jgi:hypothetical protein
MLLPSVGKFSPFKKCMKDRKNQRKTSKIIKKETLNFLNAKL